MLKKTKGIVISYIRYKETSIIVKIFTREVGLKSYIVNGVRSAKSKSKMALYQPLTLLELVLYDKESSNLNRISEAKLSYPYRTIPFDFIKSGIAMFVAEAINKSIYENYSNVSLFDFLESALIHLDSPSVKRSNFPISFLLEMSRFLGFAPEDSRSFFEELDLKVKTPHTLHVEMEAMNLLLREPFDEGLQISSAIRRALLDHLLVFYSLHLDDHSPWNSVKVLRQMIL
ncbi:DNA repair protein RecO [Belliella kenyensis]|uniref:DNA repair protein RecO n=1 Tax=Belliella kenyensis TaxID=1472724 RepID=A0ABV8EGQ2_9BACT|nr:DNA repair protein RecO [Belliella kenyensis]MCH7402296.1 DNA repair protein RecO [Belliella kenyensis]MDN3603487.1 DNA repair protein RecO [Belliella kenyensis]